MSRMGRRPVALPDKVKANLSGDILSVEGPLGKEQVKINPLAKVTVEPKQISVDKLEDTQFGKCVHGLVRSLVANAVTGVSEGFKRELDINGVGYRAEMKGSELNLVLGFSHPVNYKVPAGIKVTVDKQTHLVVSGSNREMVGRVARQIRQYRPPEPYKGKGIKYTDETIIRKVGKAAGGK